VRGSCSQYENEPQTPSRPTTIENIGVIFASLRSRAAFQATRPQAEAALAFHAALFTCSITLLQEPSVFGAAPADLDRSATWQSWAASFTACRSPGFAGFFRLRRGITRAATVNASFRNGLMFPAVLQSRVIARMALKIAVPAGRRARVPAGAALGASCFFKAYA